MKNSDKFDVIISRSFKGHFFNYLRYFEETSSHQDTIYIVSEISDNVKKNIYKLSASISPVFSNLKLLLYVLFKKKIRNKKILLINSEESFSVLLLFLVLNIFLRTKFL